MCLPLEALRRNDPRMITSIIERQCLYSVHTNRVPSSIMLIVIEPWPFERELFRTYVFERELFRTYVAGRVCKVNCVNYLVLQHKSSIYKTMYVHRILLSTIVPLKHILYRSIIFHLNALYLTVYRVSLICVSALYDHNIE